MKVAFVASEAFPLAKVGGLADVLGSLPVALQKLGLQATVYLPWYHTIWAPVVGQVSFRFENQTEVASLGLSEHNGVRYVLVGLGDFHRENPYGYNDDFRRFLRFSLAVAELLGEADIVHAHDWQSGLLPLLGRLGWFRAKTVFTIHNLAYQGAWGATDFFAWSGLPGQHYYGSGLEHRGLVNLMKAGISNAHAVTTVSPSYAQEIMTPAFGEGLEGVLQAQAYKLRGILNGLDTDYWNPASDPYIAQNFNLDQPEGKQACKEALLQEFGLPNRPTVGVVSRFAQQKGIDLVLEVVPGLVQQANLVVLGSGEKNLENGFWQAQRRFPQIAYWRGYNEALAHRIYAGCDAFLMPSRFEPCGLAQMISMRYGTLPIARAVGGLRDTIKHGDTGFLFENADGGGLAYGLQSWLGHPNPASLRQRAMQQDFSWDVPAQQYLSLYREVLGA